MIWLLIMYVIIILFNFTVSLGNIDTWAYRGKETRMQRTIRWICITIINPLFSVTYSLCYIYLHFILNKRRKIK